MHSDTYPWAQNMHKYTLVCLCTRINVHKHTQRKLTSQRKDRAGGPVEREKGGRGCWWGWWWLKLDPDSGLLAGVAPLHKHMLSFGEVFLQTDWLDRSSFFFFFFHAPTVFQGIRLWLLSAPPPPPTSLQHIPQNTGRHTSSHTGPELYILLLKREGKNCQKSATWKHFTLFYSPQKRKWDQTLRET